MSRHVAADEQTVRTSQARHFGLVGAGAQSLARRRRQRGDDPRGGRPLRHHLGLAPTRRRRSSAGGCPGAELNGGERITADSSAGVGMEPVALVCSATMRSTW